MYSCGGSPIGISTIQSPAGVTCAARFTTATMSAIECRPAIGMPPRAFSPSRSAWGWASKKPGSTERPARSMTFVPGAASLSSAASSPTAAICPARTAIACATREPRSSVRTLPLWRIRSGGSMGRLLAATTVPAALEMTSLRLDPGLLDDGPPLRGLRCEPGGELGRGGGGDRRADRLVAILDRRVLERRHRVGMYLGNDLGRRLRLHEQAPPAGDVVTGHGLADRRNVGGDRRALGRRHRDAANGAAAVLRQHALQVREHGIDAAGHEVVHGGASAAIGHVGHLDAGHALEQLAREMRRGTDAGGGEADLARVLLGLVDELGHRSGRGGGA